MSLSGTVAEGHDAPAWFREALGRRPVVDGLVVDGVAIATRRWETGGPGAPVVLVHGGTANAHWWDHVAPQLRDAREVVALDLSGHGDSGHRRAYTAAGWADEVAAVAASVTGSGPPPAVVGHSMGGLVGIDLVQRYGDRLSRLVMVDCFVAGRSAAPPPSDHVPVLRPGATLAEMVDRFRLVPDAPALPYTRHHVASHAVREVGGRWQWKFDPRILATRLVDAFDPRPAGCPVLVVRGEHGDMAAASLQRLVELIGPLEGVRTVPAGGHHLMLDRPLQLVDELRAATAPACAS